MAAVPPGEAEEARLLAEDVRALLPAGLRNAEVSDVATLPNGDRWLCLRGQAAEPGGPAPPFAALVVLSPDGALIGAQSDCPNCRAAALGWRPFPAMDGASAPEPWSVRPGGAAPLTDS